MKSPSKTDRYQKPSTTLIVDETFRKSDLHLGSAWLVYGVARLLWIDKKFIEEFPNRPSYVYSFSEELFARNTLLDYWTSLKGQYPLLHDTYLDELSGVRSAGFLAEYVWSYFQSETRPRQRLDHCSEANSRLRKRPSPFPTYLSRMEPALNNAPSSFMPNSL
jgi:hypothetical protein